jgi:hypothetical protein
VLKPNGGLSIFEPINRFAFPEALDRFVGYDVTPVVEIAHKVKAVYESIQPPDTDPMVDFDERDLIACAEKAGFTQIGLELQIAPCANTAKTSGRPNRCQFNHAA